MALVNELRLICDRCGITELAQETDSLYDISRTHPGWISRQERAFCPKCANGLELIEARHKVEIEDYIAGK